MTKFLDGPAVGKTLMLRNAPERLRVVIDRSGKVDALDQPGDEPRGGETVHWYRRERLIGTTHVNYGRGRGGFFTMAEYRVEAP